MFKKILLPLDLTDRHQAALDMAGDLAAQGGGEVVLLHVIEAIPGLSLEEEKDFYTRLERSARERLAHHAAGLKERGVACRYEVVIGGRAHETVARAAALGADLIVLTSPPFDPDRPVAGLGSLSWKIGMVARCPVLLVKAPRNG